MLDKAHIYSQVAELHIQSLDQGFLARLGPRFLRLMYQTIDASPENHLIVELDGSLVVGFVAGGSGMGLVYRHLMRNWICLGFSLFPQILRPRILRGILELLLYHRGADTAPVPIPNHELMVIAVRQEARGAGVAEKLYRGLAAVLRDDGAWAFKIVVGARLSPAHRFYQRMGAQATMTTTVHGGALSTVYIHQL